MNLERCIAMWKSMERRQKLLRSDLVSCAAEAARIKFYTEPENEEIDRRCNDLAIRLRDIADSLTVY
jgi:hypothetical protein